MLTPSQLHRSVFLTLQTSRSLTVKSKSKCAVALDIDGVILRGGKVIPGAKDAIQKLKRNNIPFIFVTNGGGMHEEVKARELSKKLNEDIFKEQVVLCHTPFKQLSQFKNKNILLIGSEECRNVAMSYDFKNIITPVDFYNSKRGILPIRPNKQMNDIQFNEKIDAIFIFHDPIDWSLEMQVMHDVLASNTVTRGYGNTAGQIPVFASNADIVYATEYPLPRFTQGAFVEAFRGLYDHHNSSSNKCVEKLQVTYYGKPYDVQYRYAEDLLSKQINGNEEGDWVYYGVGDNLLSDIRGANGAGEHWQSVLVLTGLFPADDRHIFSENNTSIYSDIPDYVTTNVNTAVDLIIEKHL